MRKLIQITSSTAPDGDGATTIFLYGLCDDGTAWELYRGDALDWTPLPPIPKDDAPAAAPAENAYAQSLLRDPGAFDDEICAHCGQDLSEHHARNLKCPTGPTIYRARSAKEDTAAAVLLRLGDDGMAWAEEFCATAKKLGYGDLDIGWVFSWFANAIEHSNDVRRWRAPAPPVGVEQLRQRIDALERGIEGARDKRAWLEKKIRDLELKNARLTDANDFLASAGGETAAGAEAPPEITT